MPFVALDAEGVARRIGEFRHISPSRNASGGFLAGGKRHHVPSDLHHDHARMAKGNRFGQRPQRFFRALQKGCSSPTPSGRKALKAQ